MLKYGKRYNRFPHSNITTTKEGNPVYSKVILLTAKVVKGQPQADLSCP
jgi:hypothetical protein